MPVGIAQKGERHRVRIESRVTLLLPTVDVEMLSEIPLAIQEPLRNERYAQVTGGFEMVTRQNAQTTGVDRQCLADTELG